jgi:alanyl-tRNA synthetase
MFGEKYNDSAVRVVEVPGASMELCGGTHVERTAQVKIVFSVFSGLSAIELDILSDDMFR